MRERVVRCVLADGDVSDGSASTVVSAIGEVMRLRLDRPDDWARWGLVPER